MLNSVIPVVAYILIAHLAAIGTDAPAALAGIHLKMARANKTAVQAVVLVAADVHI